MLGSNILAGASGQGGDSGYQIEKSLRFNSDDSSVLSRTFASAGNRQQWTISFWFKLSKTTGYQYFIHANPYTNPYCIMQMDNNASTIAFYDYSSTGFGFVLSPSVQFRDPSAWQHFVVAFDTTQATASDRVKWYHNGKLLALDRSGYTTYPSQNYNTNVNQAVVHQFSDASYGLTSYMADVHFIDGQQLAATDFGKFDNNNVWQPKSYTGTYGTNGFHLDFSDNSSVSALGTDSSGNGNNWTPNNFYVGTSPWNQTQSNWAGLDTYPTAAYSTTPSNIFNGVTDGSNANIWYCSGAGTLTLNNLAAQIPNPVTTFEVWGYERLAPMYVTINGTQHTVDLSYDATNSTYRWASITVNAQITSLSIQGTDTSYWGVGGIRVNGKLLVDSGISNSWVVADNDSLTDTPTNYGEDTGVGGEVRGNYCTWNPLAKNSSITLSNGNLKVTQSAIYPAGVLGTMAVSSGKWYWEFTSPPVTNWNPEPYYIGFAQLDLFAFRSSGYMYLDPGVYSYTIRGGYKQIRGVQSNTGWGDQSPGTVMGLALDLDNGTYKLYANGTLLGTVDDQLPAGLWAPLVYVESTAYGSSADGTNFGQRPWAYTPPSGYKALCTQNLPDPPVEDPSKHFDTKLWTGNSSTQTISGYNFEPDLLFYKARSGAYHWGVQDSVRGVGKYLSSNLSAAEHVETAGTNGVTAFTSDGFTLNGNGYYLVNYSGTTMAGWAWDAGSSNTSVAAGDLNTGSYNQSQVWSNAWSGTAGYGSFANLHDANFTTNYVQASATLTINPSINSNKIRIYCYNHSSGGGQYLKINGVDVTDQLEVGDYVWNEITGITAPITSIELYSADYSSNLITVKAIEIDGKILVDQGVTITNRPSIATTYRANPTAGFSIVSWTGNATQGETIAHGLNAPPELIIVKNRDSGSANWPVYHKGASSFNRLYFDAGVASSSGTNWDSQDPSSNIFYVGNNADTNGSSNAMIAYCFSSVEGYSKIGTYTGNATTPGPFVYLGFKPAFVLIKCASAGSGWNIIDNKRDEYNAAKALLFPNTSDAEYSGSPDRLDLLSNGFSILSGASNPNTAQTWVYAAFAENPFKTTRAR